MKINDLSILIILFLIFPIITSGSRIAITTQTSSEKVIQGNEITLQTRTINGGDETSYDVQISLITPEGFQSNPLLLGNLIPNSPYEENITIKINSEIIPGTYTLWLLTDYKDVKGYPFSTISPITLSIRNLSMSKIFGFVQDVTLSKDGRIEKSILKVRNLDSMAHEIKINLLLPRELKSNFWDEGEKIIQVGGKEEQDIIFDISSFGALPGSTYVIFASLDYEENGIHYSSIARGIVRIVESGELNLEGSYDEENTDFGVDIVILALIFSFIIFLAIFLYYKFSRKIK